MTFGLKLKKFSTSLLLITPLISAVTIADEQCDKILAQGIYDLYESTSRQDYGLALRSYACASKQSSAGNNLSADILENLKIGIDGTSQSSSQACTTFEQNQFSSDYTHTLKITANDTIVNAWRDCITNKQNGLLCEGFEVEGNSNAVNMKVSYYPLSPLYPDTLNLSLTTSNLVGNSGNPSLSDLGFGDMTLGFYIQDTSTSASFIVNGNGEGSGFEGFTASCSYTIPKEKEVIPEPKFYKLQNKYSNKCLGLKNASTSIRTPLVQYDCNTPTAGGRHQMFDLVEDQNGYVVIKSALSQQCIHVYNASKGDRAEYWTWSCSASHNDYFKYKLLDAGAGYKYIQSKHSGKCAHIRFYNPMSDGERLWTWSCTNADHHKFKLLPVYE